MEDGKKGRDNPIIFLYTFFNHFIFFLYYSLMRKLCEKETMISILKLDSDPPASYPCIDQTNLYSRLR